MPDRVVRSTVDMRAVGRVASRVDVTEVRLVEVSAMRTDKVGGTLEPIIQHAHSPLGCEGGSIRIQSRYEFKVDLADTPAFTVTAVYHLFYALSGDEPVADDDLKQFAAANGAYHSWPFVRELLFSMSSRMGLPAFTLPVMSFMPPRPAKPAAPPQPQPTPTQPTAQAPDADAQAKT
jgi:hypothetical protein